MKLKETNKILLKISILIIIIGLIVGIALCVYIVFVIGSFDGISVDNSNFSSFLKLLGYMALPLLSLYIIMSCILRALVIDAIIWGIYGLVKLIRKLIIEKRWKVFIIICIVMISFLLIVVIIRNIKIPRLDKNTIGSIAYDYNSDLGYTIYIKESTKYVPYLVLTYNYNKTNNALCLRQNVVGGENGYIIDYNGTISKSKIYDGWMQMQSYSEYKETDVDKYLTEEFLKKFDIEVLDKICNTKLNFSTYEINRKFFILSREELNSDADINNSSVMQLKYFNSDNRTTTNDIGIESPYWIRTSTEAYWIVGYNGFLGATGNGAKFGIRPAFTIPNNTKITKIYDENLMKEIYVFDI